MPTNFLDFSGMMICTENQIRQNCGLMLPFSAPTGPEASIQDGALVLTAGVIFITGALGVRLVMGRSLKNSDASGKGESARLSSGGDVAGYGSDANDIKSNHHHHNQSTSSFSLCFDYWKWESKRPLCMYILDIWRKEGSREREETQREEGKGTERGLGCGGGIGKPKEETK